jgi:hypothetical protein
MNTITKEQILEELRHYEAELIDPISTNDLGAMKDKAVTLVGYLARSATLVAEAKRILNAEKKIAYEKLEFRYASTGRDLKPMLAKDYISAKCGEGQYVADMADRMNAALTHTMEMMRSIMSAEKTLLANLRESI